MEIIARNKVVKLSLKQFLVDYASNSSIHGIKYVFNGKSIFTRLFWAAAVVFSILFSGYFLSNKFIKWQFEPDIGMKKEILNIREIPFPGVTICPQTKTKMEFMSFRKTYKHYWEHFKLYGLSDVNAARFESLLHICDPELSFKIQLNESKVSEGHAIVRILKEISYSIDDSMLFCKFRNAMKDCTSLFNKIVTDKGVCFSFNMLNYNEIFNSDILPTDFDSFYNSKNSTWSLDKGYETDDLNAYPYPVVSQEYDALRIILKTTDIDLDYVCQGSNQGFKIFFHLPGDIPSISGKHLFLPIKHDATVSLTAKTTKISDSLKGYTPRQRNCYLTHERPLQFFKLYSKNACNLECFANYTLKTCGCVKFSMPRKKSSKICNHTQINCTMNAKRKMMLSYNMEKPGELECGCLPSCTEINYNLESFQTEFDYKTLFESYSYDVSDMPGVIMSRITVFFQEPQFEATERYPLFTFSDYIASCGGVLGLFMGFSILSFIELFYYFICWVCRAKCS